MPSDIPDATLAAMRTELAELRRRWTALAPGATLELALVTAHRSPAPPGSRCVVTSDIRHDAVVVRTAYSWSIVVALVAVTMATGVQGIIYSEDRHADI